MEHLPINQLLKNKITKVDHQLVPMNFQGDINTKREIEQCVAQVVDVLGMQSAQEQGLNRVITTAEKMRLSTVHLLYLLKDSEANGGRGEAIGMLKVGMKHLFLFDELGQVVEVEPLCVLDFYVAKNRQRLGYGKQLFDYMLRDAGLEAHHLAIDGPSPKMEQFLMKNYGLTHLVRQNNNFAIAPQFFDTYDPHRCSTVASRRLTAPVGRFAAPKPHSAIGTVIHGGDSGPHPSLDRTPLEEALGAPGPEVQHYEHEVWSQSPEPEGSPSRPRSLALAGEEGAGAGGVAGAGAGGVAGTNGPGWRRDSQLTDRGFFDIKFYHNKLW